MRLVGGIGPDVQRAHRGRGRLRRVLLGVAVAAAGMFLLAPVAAGARTLHIVLVRTSFMGDARAHLYSQSDVQDSIADQQTYMHNLSYGQVSFDEHVFSVTLASDLIANSTNGDAVPLLQPAATAVAGQPGGTAALESADIVALLVPPAPAGFYQWQQSISIGGHDRTVGLVLLPDNGTDNLGPSSDVEWGYWMQEFLHDVQDVDNHVALHPAGYADGYSLMDSCYPCGLGLFDLASHSIVEHHLGVLPGAIPDSHITVVDATGTGPLDVVRNLEPVDYGGDDPPPAFGQPQQGIKILLDRVTWPTGPGASFSTSRYYLLESHRRAGAEIYGHPLRLMSEGVHIAQVIETRADNDGSGGLTPRPVDALLPCQQAPSGQRCAGMSGEGMSSGACTASQPNQNLDYCYPFKLWQPFTTFHGADDIDVSFRPGDFPNSLATRTEVTRTSATPHADVFIVPWETPPMNTSETTDLWIDSSCNGYENPGSGGFFLRSDPHPLRYGRRSSPKAQQRTVIGNGDDPCVNHENRLYAEIHNAGGAIARDAHVNFQVGGIDSHGHLGFQNLGTVAAPPIPPHGEVAVDTTWTPTYGDATSPYAGYPTRILATIEPGTGATSVNNFAEENIEEYDTIQRASHIPARAGVIVAGVPRTSPLPAGLDLLVHPRSAARIPLSGAGSIHLPPGGRGGVIPVDILKTKGMRPGAVREINVTARELAFHVESPLSFGYPTRIVHGEGEDAGSLGVFVRGVAPSRLTVKTSAHEGRLTVHGQLMPRLRAVLTLDLLIGSSKPAGRLRIARTLLVSTDRRGAFRSSLHQPKGRWVVHAFWQGDLRHGLTTSWPMASPPAFVAPAIIKGRFLPTHPTTQEGVTMGCPKAVTSGQTAAVAGHLSPVVAGAAVFVTFSSGSTDQVVRAPVGPGGSWSASYPLGQPGSWQVVASYFGDLGFAPAAPASCDIAVTQPPTTPTSLTVACPKTGTTGSVVAVSGTLSPAAAGAAVSVTYTEGGTTVVDHAITDASGSYADSTTASSAGQWTVQAGYAGDATHQPSSSATCAFQVRQTTTVTLACPANATSNSGIAVSGALGPAVAGASVAITYSTPNGPITDQAATDAAGSFGDSQKNPAPGSWTSQASYAGDATHAPATSPICQTTVS